MPAPQGAAARLRLLKRLKRDVAFFAVVFAALFGVAVAAWPAFEAEDRGLEAVVAVTAVALLFIALAFARPIWHAFANRYFLRPVRRLPDPWVVDGDTIDDRATGIRYRFANIDAPEIDGAKCYREGARGQLAKWALVRMVREAKVVAVRPTFRTDRFGRRVAFVLIDGQDAGDILVARGLAVPWGGWRKRWCGPRGGLAKIAKAGAMAHACKACRA